MTKEKYKELTENMLDEYMKEWHDFDIGIPSYEQAQKQEMNGTLILENVNQGEKTVKVKNKNIDIDKEMTAAFGKQTSREALDDKLYYQELEEAAEAKRIANIPLTLSEKRLADEATLVNTEGIDHSLDEDVDEAFGSNRKTDGLKDLQEAIGSVSEGEILLEAATVDFCDSNGSKPFKFSGKAFRVDHINKNSRRYPRNLVEGALQAARSKTLSCMSGHPSPGATDPSLVVGSITLGEIDADNWVRYKGTLSETRKGKDLQILLRDKSIADVSLRSRGKTKSVKVDGQSVEEVCQLSLKGLDLVLEGSFTGAKADEIFNAVGA